MHQNILEVNYSHFKGTVLKAGGDNFFYMPTYCF